VAQDIIEALRHDHQELRKMFARLEAATGKRRRDLFQRLVAELVRHEVAEEAIANARIKEESRAEELLKDMEKLDPGSAEFTAKLARLRRDVERHAEAEETKEFPRVAKKETTERLAQMGRTYEVAKKAAPTRPHPSTPNTPAANMVAGPFAAVLDRTRDAVRDVLKSAS